MIIPHVAISGPLNVVLEKGADDTVGDLGLLQYIIAVLIWILLGRLVIREARHLGDHGRQLRAQIATILAVRLAVLARGTRSSWSLLTVAWTGLTVIGTGGSRGIAAQVLVRELLGQAISWVVLI